MTESTSTFNLQTSPFLLCPGQGAQHVGMGKAWYDASPAARVTIDKANDVLGYDLKTLMFEGPEAELNRTDNAQPAIYVASVACYRALVEKGELKDSEMRAAAGLSLGEFTALHLAGAYSFEDGLKLVRLRGQAMQDAANAGLSIIHDLLLQVKLRHPDVSIADLWTLAGCSAVEFIGGPKVKHTMGRSDAADGSHCPSSCVWTGLLQYFAPNVSAGGHAESARGHCYQVQKTC